LIDCRTSESVSSYITLAFGVTSSLLSYSSNGTLPNSWPLSNTSCLKPSISSSFACSRIFSYASPTYIKAKLFYQSFNFIYYIKISNFKGLFNNLKSLVFIIKQEKKDTNAKMPSAKEFLS